MEQSPHPHVRHVRWYILLVLVIISVALWAALFHEERNGKLVFAMLDVGQGDALFIESPTGKQVVVDGGPHNNLKRALGTMMPFYDKHIDMIVVTNPDADHYEGFISLLDTYKVDFDLEPGTFNKHPAYGELENKIMSKGIQRILAIAGEKIDLGGGAYLEVLFPDRDVSGLSSNDGSIVMRLVYGNTSVLLQGDSTEKIEHYLASLYGTGLHSTILKVGHHGSRTSSSEEYVQDVSPEWSVISSGRSNEYGHPHTETIATMNKLGIPTYDTCNNGTLVFESDGTTFRLQNKNLKPAVAGCTQ